ncbi:alkyl hydroperoxide reductase [Methylacidiphilum kamchatkense Kam1]|uniref:Alkyl hydroperoxide reductase n=1 Tax=Methylacidiphilum kamchatkense Kam1 TaxID=1202785 RepID=A0A0C1UQQ3_9BACT|nr:thioredoxin family protein [Methylacidiphilum kamchatkense]KIE58679.1 alkyl hydroperoxide reductase [Methylacidiphilum kamchatkense Kam1]QDQ41933.1 peroxiredoxin [Methylacidiphilum kamchatkense Kam1]
MAVTSLMLPLGTKAPEFSLPDAVSGKIFSLSDFDSFSALLVMFICNHCPYVKHIQHHLAQTIARYQKEGLAAVAINSNDVSRYPDDSPEKMKEVALQVGYTFPYLFDETQETAKAYKAVCTPDFFLFDKERKLVYRGRYDDSRPNSGVAVTGADLSKAIEATLKGEPVDPDQKPSIGCSLKWKIGNEPSWWNF